jgi:beta-lactamase regulating signal transducer with metallopeptidase domain
MIDSWFSTPLVDALGWTILHSLWQASLLAGILWIVSRIPRGISSPTRYWLAYGTLLGQFAWSVVTFFQLYEPALLVEEAVAGQAFYFLTEAPTTPASPASEDTTLLNWVVMVWLVGALIGAAKLCWSFGRVRRMQRRALTAVPRDFARLVDTLADRLDLTSQFQLGISEQINGPALVGHLRPMLLFPVAVINQLSVEEVEVVILHELAHLKRKDHWWNLLQCLLEVVFYYHPIIWWIGARIREEREHCCDDLVLSAGSDQITYAKTLLFFAQQRQPPPNALALAGKTGGLLGRIQRFINQQNIPYQMKSRLFLLPLITLVALLTTAAYVPTVEESQANEETSLPLAENMAPAPDSYRGAPSTDLSFPEMTAEVVDSLPMGRHQVSSYRNGESTEVLVEDGEIKELKINGETIPESEYDQYQEMVEGMLGQSSSGRMANRFPQVRGYMKSYRISPEGDTLSRNFWENRRPRGRMEWYEIDGEGDTLIHNRIERSFELLNDQFPQMEFRFEDLRDQMKDLQFEYQQLGDSNFFYFEDMSEKLREQFEGMDVEMEKIFQLDGDTDGIFRWNGEDGGVFRFDFDGDSTFFKIDSTINKTFNFYFDNDGQPMLPGQGLENRFERQRELLRERGRRLDEEQLNLEELDQMIDKLEQRKAEQLRRMEERESMIDERNRAMQRSFEERAKEIESVRRERVRNASPDYQRIIKQLEEEGLLEMNKELKKLMITESSLKVNGKKASAAAHQRYLEIFKSRYGNTLGDKFSVTIKLSESR